MFESLINRAAHSVESVVVHYAVRAAVAVPFLIAVGFGLAAVVIKLEEYYSRVTSFSIVAVGFAVVGLIAAAVLAASGTSSANISTSPPSPEPLTAEAGSTPPAPSSVIDPDTLLAVAGIIAPKALPALPSLLGFIRRNWLLIASSIVVIYMMSLDRSQKEQASAPAPAPAE